eukprot:TRINITY_DN46718_c0_g1_i1.p1 TRINITY_DN46718_c0_g1~~TRINITY_DN46718_c0_g1_i1.p1  ORF type:complete len:661 (+),score=201.54 TRINITY_DN46718_c0_g1_i1:53-2035(+)
MVSRTTSMLVMVLCCSFALTRAANMAASMPGPAIGIDLGTTYSVVGVWRDGKVEIVPNEMGNRITPSVVGFTASERLVGDGAKNQMSLNPLNTIFSAKRLIGRQYTDKAVVADRSTLPYNIVQDRNGNAAVSVWANGANHTFTPPEVSAMILQKMKHMAEEYLGVPSITSAVITVPAYFDDVQRLATRDAGRIAGFENMRIMNEPTAAALAYGMDKEDQKVLVYDLGGGTFDVSLLNVDEGFFEVLSTSGDTHLGGEDFDNRLVDHFRKIILRKHGVDLLKPKGGNANATRHALARLRQACEAAKRQLSTQPEARVEVENLIPTDSGAIDLSEKITRSKFEELTGDLLRATLNPVRQVLEDAGVSKDDIAEVVLVGGSTRIPKVRALLREFFGKEPSTGLHADEAVAHGAAVQAAVLSGEDVGSVLIVDTLPLSVGIETAGGVMTTMIKRGTPVPTEQKKVFSTYQDHQSAVTIKVYQGERAMTKDNRLLGSFELTGIPPAPRGVPQIEVSFVVDKDGLLQVSAHDKASSGGLEYIRIENTMQGFTEEEIARKVEEAKQFEDEDRQIRALHAERQGLETAAYGLKQQLDDEEKLGGKVNSDDHAALSEAVEEAIAWLDAHADVGSFTLEDVQQQAKALRSVSDPIVQRVYSNSGQQEDEL